MTFHGWFCEGELGSLRMKSHDGRWMIEVEKEQRLYSAILINTTGEHHPRQYLTADEREIDTAVEQFMAYVRKVESTPAVDPETTPDFNGTKSL